METSIGQFVNMREVTYSDNDPAYWLFKKNVSTKRNMGYIQVILLKKPRTRMSSNYCF